ncbi:MAG: hypothetical protein R2817_03415 [Flavobacteriales bacterium]
MPKASHRALLFLLMLGVCSWYPDMGRNANTTSRAATVAAIAERGDLCIDAYHEETEDKALVNGHYYSEKAPLPALLVAPFWVAAYRSGRVRPGPCGLLTDGLLALGGFLCGSLPLALIMLYTWRRLEQLHPPRRAYQLTLVAFLGSFPFLYAGSFQGHLLAALFLLLAWDNQHRERYLLSGALAGAAVLCEYGLFLFPLAWVLRYAYLREWGVLARTSLGGLPFVAVLLAHNMAVSGSPFSLPYDHTALHTDTERFLGLDLPDPAALWGLLFSNYRGLFVHAPLTLLALHHLVERGSFSSVHRVLTHPLIVPSAALVLMVSAHSMWWGGWAWGPRHLTSLAVLLLAAGLPTLTWTPTRRKIFLVLGTWGLVLNIGARLTSGYGLPTGVEQPFLELIVPGLLRGHFGSGPWTDLLHLGQLAGAAGFMGALILTYRWSRRLLPATRT